jgi:UDP-N-acetylmuramoylalanine--D-glutamate ligase
LAVSDNYNPQIEVNKQMNEKLQIQKCGACLGLAKVAVGAAILGKNKYSGVLCRIGNDKNRIKNVLSQYEIDFEEGGHTQKRLLQTDLAIKSPGIPDKAKIVENLKAACIPIIDEIEYASWFTDAKIIAITGSNGKTTTTLLTAHILRKAGLNVGIGGNVGSSFACRWPLSSLIIMFWKSALFNWMVL